MIVVNYYGWKKKCDKPVYNGHWRETENVPFMSSCPYIGSNYMHYSLHGENETDLYRE